MSSSLIGEATKIAPRPNVIDLLADEDKAAFRAMLAQRDITLDDARRWIVTKGYSISRSAIALCMRRFRSLPMSKDVGHISNADMRTQLIQWIQTLDDDRLAAMSIFATYMKNSVPVAS